MMPGSPDPQAILRALKFGDATEATPVQGGSDTMIWRVERKNEVYALRVFRPGDDDVCVREQAVMEAAAAGGIPVPEVHARGVWQDHSALLLSWLPGRPLVYELRARPWRIWPLGVAFGRMLAAINALSAPDVLRQRSDAWINWMPGDNGLLRKRLQTSTQRTDALLHLDFHPFNVLTDGKRIIGVIDWRNACAGEPRADVARTISILLVDRGDDESLRRLHERGLRLLFARACHFGYEQAAEPLGNMALFYAWAGAVMEYDLASKRQAPALERIRRWTLKWKRRAGCM